MAVVSNLTRLLAMIRALPRSVAFDAPAGGGEAFGRVLARRAMEGIRDRSLLRQVDPKGKQWEPNEPRYKARKGGKPVGELTGEMLSVDQLLGELELTPDKMTVRYGKSAAVRQRARWFQQGVRSGKARRWRQKPRFFYDLDAQILDNLAAGVREELARRRAGG
jgi:hypothetical protein